MRMRIVFSFFLVFLSGIIISVSESTGLKIFFVILVLLYSYFFLTSRKGRKKLILYSMLLLITFSISLLRGFFAIRHAEKIEEKISESENFYICGTVDKKERKEGYIKYYINDAKLKEGGFNINNVLVTSDDESIDIGSRIVFSGKKGEIREAENYGSFDEREYLKSKGIFLKIKSPEFISEKKNHFSIKRMLFLLRENISEFFERTLPGEEADIASAMALGAKENLESDVKNLFSEAGIAYLLVVSGQHVSLVGLSLFKLLRKARLSFKTVFYITCPVVFFYAIMTGFSVSCQRAVIMCIILMLSKVLGEEYDMITAVSIAGFILFMKNPFSIYDSGAVFSFAAAFVIACAVLPVDKKYSEYLHFRHRFEIGSKLTFFEKIKKAFLSAIIINLGLLPVVSYYFFEIPVYQVILSVVIMPLSSVLIPLTLLYGVFHMRILMPLVHLMIFTLEACADFSTKLPFSSLITGRPSLIKIIFYYAVYFIFLKSVQAFIEKKKYGEEKLISDEKRERLFSIRRKCAFFTAMTLMFLLSFFLINKPSSFGISMLSVGQGDGIFLSSRGNKYFFIDGGSSSEKEIGKYTILPFLKAKGIRRIDAWFVTHTDTDHVSGLIEALEDGYRIKRIIFSEYVVKDNENFDRICEAACKNNTEILYMKKGDAVTTKSFTLLDVFSQDLENKDDANANSLCLYLRSEEERTKGFSMLFTGDASANAEETIAKEYFSDGENHITIFKSSHHGSRFSNSEILLDFARPEIAIVSAGVNNMYGHPAPETLERFDDRSIPYYCTIQCGEIDIMPEKGRNDMISIFIYT